MAAAWTTDDLVARVKRKAQRPLTDLNFTDADILNVAEEELYTYLVPLIRTSAESFFLKTYRTPIVNGTASYRIPPDCSAGTIRDVWLVDQNNLGMQIPLVEPESRYRYMLSNTPYATPAVACLIADEVVFYPTPSVNSTYYISILYEQRRSRLTTVSACALVATSPSTTTFTTASTPSPSLSGATVDLIEGQPNFDLLSTNNVVSSYALPNITLSTAVTGTTRVGGYICPAGYSCVVPLPDLFHFALVFATAAAMCEETNDQAGASSFRSQLASRLNGLSASVEPRVTGQAPVAVNWSSPLRQNRYYGGWWGR